MTSRFSLAGCSSTAGIALTAVLILTGVNARSATWKDQVETDWLRQRNMQMGTNTWEQATDWALALATRSLALVERSRPLPEPTAEIKALKDKRAKTAGMTAENWQSLYLEARWLRRKIVLAHPLLEFDELFVNKVPPPLYSHQCDQYLGRHSQAGPGPVIVKFWKEGGQERSLLAGKLPAGSVHHPELSFDAKRVIFGFCDHTVPSRELRRFFIYEAEMDGSDVRQLTGTPTDPLAGAGGRATVLIEDFDPTYLPEGGFVFVSTRSQGFGRCHGGRYTPSYVLYRANADGTGIRQISFGEANEWDPTVMNDGRIIYSRWDYINRHDTVFQSLWVTRPDGSGTAHFYGNYTRNPCMIAEAKPIPGSPKIVCTATAHHSYTSGSIMLVDPRRGEDGLAPVTRVTPEAPFPETEGWPTGTYASPWPLSEELFLVAFCPDRLVGQGGVQRYNGYGIFLIDTLGGRELIYSDPSISCFQPMPVKAETAPPAIPSMLSPKIGTDTGICYIQNVYQSTQPIPRGSIKRLRVNRIIGQPTASVPARSRAANEILKGIVGTVPVDENGSVAFRVPAEEPLQFQALDENGMAVMTMRTQMYVQKGEFISCVGCHEPRNAAPGRARMPAGLTARDLDPPAGPKSPEGFSFMRTVQPVLDRHCIRCHGLEKTEGGIVLLNSLKGFGNAAFESLTANGRVSVAQRNSETFYSKPKDYFAHAGKLPKIILEKHKERLDLDRESFQRIADWLDLNAQFYGDYSQSRAEQRFPSPEAQKPVRDYVRTVFGAALAQQPFEALVNWVEPAESRILKAPLAAEAGGWGQLKPAWKDAGDPGYLKMKELVAAAAGGAKPLYVSGTCGQEHCRCGCCWVRRVNEAMALVRSVGSDANAWIAKIDGAAPKERVKILKLLTEHSWSPAFAAAQKCTKDSNQEVRIAAIEAAARLGAEKALPDLLQLLQGKDGPEKEAALSAFGSMPGGRVSAAIAQAIPDSPAAVKTVLLGLLAKRSATQQADAVVAAAKDGDLSVRIAALHTLGKLADADKLPVLLQFIMNTVDEQERSAATDAAINTYARTRNAQAVADSVLEALPKASVPIRCSFLQFLGKVGGAKALAEVQRNLEHAEARVQTAAIKALGLWPDAGPMQTLLGLAESRKANEQRQIALRGYVTLVRTDSSSGARQQVTRLKAAMKVATRVEDKKMVLSALSEIPDPAALKFAESLQGDESIGEMAEQVSVAIARSICGSYWEESVRAMKSIADASANSGLQAQARDIIQLIELTHPSKLPGASKAALLELTENALEGLDI